MVGWNYILFCQNILFSRWCQNWEAVRKATKNTDSMPNTTSQLIDVRCIYIKHSELLLYLFSRKKEIKVDKVSFDLRVISLNFHTKFTMSLLIGNACWFSKENLARILGFKGMCNAQNLWTTIIKPVHPIPICVSGRKWFQFVCMGSSNFWC